MKINSEKKWLRDKAAKEDGCFVGAGAPVELDKPHPWTICPKCGSRNVAEEIRYCHSAMTCRDCGYLYADYGTGER